MGFEYRTVFIATSPDCPTDVAETPPAEYRGKPTVAAQEYAMLHNQDFVHTMSEILSSIWIARKGGGDLSPDEHDVLRKEYFSTGRPCLRASPLAKRYGWGFAFDAEGRVALVGSDSDEYQRYLKDPDLEQLVAMRSSRK